MTNRYRGGRALARLRVKGYDLQCIEYNAGQCVSWRSTFADGLRFLLGTESAMPLRNTGTVWSSCDGRCAFTAPADDRLVRNIGVIRDTAVTRTDDLE